MRGLVPAFMVIFLGAGVALAQLKTGDVAIIAYSTDSPDAFAWVALCDMPSNTVIHFTNSSVSNGWFRWGDHLGRAVAPGPLTWTCTNTIRAGTVVSWVSGTQKCWSVGVLSGGAPSLSADGDTLIAYTGSIVSNASGSSPWFGDCSGATVLFGLSFANAGWDDITGGGANTSFIPPGLSTNSATAVYAGSRDNGYYSSPPSGLVDELRRAIGRAGNWTTSDTVIMSDVWPKWFRIVDPHGTVIGVW